MSNLYELFTHHADADHYRWPGIGNLSHLVTRWLNFRSSWKDFRENSGTHRCPVSHSGHLSAKDRATFPQWWRDHGRAEYEAFKATW